jgi:hypothetical protein
LQQKLELRLIKNNNETNSATFPISTGEWGPILLIHKYNGEPEKGDLKTWLVEVRVTAPGASGVVRLKLKFDRPLPELDKWAK